MSLEGGPPPPPPPVPTPSPPTIPPPPAPSPSRRPGLTEALVVALAVSLAVNALLALRLKDQTDQTAGLRRRVAQLQGEIEKLRADIDALKTRRPPASGDVLDRVAAAVAKIRELAFKREVDPEVLTDAQLATRVSEQFQKDNPRTDIEASDKVLTALGLLGGDDDLFDIILGVQTEQVGGFYDTKTRRLVVGGDAKDPKPLDRVLLAHEFTHALTDQYYDLSRLDRLQDERKDDEVLAYLSLVEGDATVIMFEYAEKFLTLQERASVASEGAAVATERLDAAPKVVRRSLLFPYEQGVRFVQDLLQSGGLAAVNRAYQDPPTSTEQILHPSKYLGRRDDPTPVTMPDLARTLGRGWSALPGGGVGELDVRLIVDEFLPRKVAEEAGAGWDGGRYAAAESSAGTLVAILTVWDSEAEAREATDVFRRWLPLRFGKAGSAFGLAGGVGGGWESPKGAGAVLRSGSRALLLVGPDRASVERARGAFSGF